MDGVVIIVVVAALFGLVGLAIGFVLPEDW